MVKDSPKSPSPAIKRPGQSPEKTAKELPLLTLIQEAKRRVEVGKALLDRPPQAPTAGSLDCQVMVCNLVSEGLDLAASQGKDRFQVAADMGRYLGTGNITKPRLDKLAAPSQEGYDLKALEIAAFCQAVGSTSLVRYLAELCGEHVVTSEELALVQLGRLAYASSEFQRNQAQLLDSLARSSGGQS